jgi:hypothetical protein
MILNDPNGEAAEILPDRSLRSTTVIQTDMNAITGFGRGWTLPFTQTGAANTTDNIVFFLSNASDKKMEVMLTRVSSAEAGLWTLEQGRTYTSGGAAISLRQLNVLSGATQDISCFFGTALVLGGTAVDLQYERVAADESRELLDWAPVVLPPSGSMALKFKGDAGGAVMGVTVKIHGANPWE